MYQALYRKYRPQTFNDVIGQPHVTITLKNELISGRVGHAYLFIGSRGTGKTTCAKIFAKAVNCIDLKDGDPCGECDLCKAIESGEIMDIVELDAASNNSVNDIREICDSAIFTPASAKYRVYIIDEVHMLSAGAFNALLKTLEEPPPHVIFILATTEAHKIPATILSRCQRFEFHKISVDDIADRLEYVIKKENASIDRSAALLIAKISDGAMRDALAILDKCLGVSKNITDDIVVDTVGIASQEHIWGIAKSIFENSPQDALEIIDKLNHHSKDMMRLTQEIIGYFRNIMLAKTLKNAKSLLIVSDEEYNKILELSSKSSIETIIYILDSLQKSFEKMNRGCDSRTEIEMCLIKLCSPRLNCSNEAILARLENLERLVKVKEQNVASQPINTDEKNLKPKNSDILKPIEKPIVKEENSKEHTIQKTMSISDLQKNARKMQNWQEVLNVLKNYSHTIATAFKGSEAYISGDFVLIDSKNEMAFELLRKSSQRDKMRVAIKEITGKSYKLGPYNSEKSENNEIDPLLSLAQTARELGIDVTEV